MEICDARKTHNIPNWLTFPAILIGIITHGVLDGERGLVSACIALGLMFLIMLPIILRRGMGMGDLKLLLATSTFAGYSTIPVGFVLFGSHRARIRDRDCSVFGIFQEEPPQRCRTFHSYQAGAALAASRTQY